MSNPWRPHSSDEAAWFEEAYCARCRWDENYRSGEADSCPIAAQGFGVAIGLEPPRQWQQDEDGPHCTGFEESASPTGPEGVSARNEAKRSPGMTK